MEPLGPKLNEMPLLCDGTGEACELGALLSLDWMPGTTVLDPSDSKLTTAPSRAGASAGEAGKARRGL